MMKMGEMATINQVWIRTRQYCFWKKWVEYELVNDNALEDELLAKM